MSSLSQNTKSFAFNEFIQDVLSVISSGSPSLYYFIA